MVFKKKVSKNQLDKHTMGKPGNDFTFQEHLACIFFMTQTRALSSLKSFACEVLNLVYIDLRVLSLSVCD